MVNQVRVQPSAPHRTQQANRPSFVSRAKRKAISTWTRSQIGHRSEYSVERLLAFRDYYQRVSLGRVIAVCSLTPIPALVVTLAIDLIPLAPPSQGWQGNYALWFRLLISTFAISLGLITQIKEVITTQPISTIGTFKVAVATSISYVGVTIFIASSWRFPIPFGYVLLVGPYVTIFSFFTVFEIGPRVLAHSSILRQQIKSQLMIVSTQGVVAVAYPLFSAVFNQLTGIEQTAFVIVMPVIKFVTKQIIADAAESLNENLGPIVVFSVDVFNVFYVAICMQAATSTVTTLLFVGADSFHVIVALRSIFRKNNAIHSKSSEPSYYLSDLPHMVQILCQDSTHPVPHIRIRAPFPLPLSDESRMFIDNLNKFEYPDAQNEIESVLTRYDQNMIVQEEKDARNQEAQSVRIIVAVKPQCVALSCPKQCLSSTTSIEEFLVTSKAHQLKQSVHDALQALFHSEYVLMGEYIEFMLPLLYALYLAVLFHLPIAAYYPHTSTMTTNKLQGTLVSILAFSAVEFVAFIGLLLMLKRKFGFTPLYQLAFVLETQVNTLQGHLFVWTPFILQLTLVHYVVSCPSTSNEEVAFTIENDVGEQKSMGFECNFTRIEGVVFSDGISALTHVLELIDEMLMSPEEALIKATGTNQLLWIESLLKSYNGDLTDPIVCASANGHVETIFCLLQTIRKRGRSSWRKALQKAVKTAATHRQLNVISVFLPQIATEALLEMYESTWQVLDEAAAHGYQDVVRFTTEFATKWGYIESYTARSESDALARAVAGGFDDVAIYLLGNYRIEWNMKNALERAIEGGRPDIIEWVYVIYSQRTGVGQILAGLVRDGNIDAVKYLCTHFDIPPHAINHAFRNATGISTIHFLYKTGCVSPGSITTVFRDASRRGIFDQEGYYSFEEQLEVVKLLCNDSCIPPRAIRSAFMGAAARGHEDLLELLWTDLRLNDQTFIKAFNVAVNNDNVAITKALFNGGRISAQATNNALLVSSKRGYLAIVQLLIDVPAIFRSTKKKVFLDAVRNNRQLLVQRVCDKGSWPARVLKRAVRIAADRKLKELLQKLTRLRN